MFPRERALMFIWGHVDIILATQRLDVRLDELDKIIQWLPLI